jgi:membrane-bound ClpP family serine protease
VTYILLAIGFLSLAIWYYSKGWGWGYAAGTQMLCFFLALSLSHQAWIRSKTPK